VVLKGNNIIDRLIGKFSPSMPKKGRNRIIYARLTGNKKFFGRFITQMGKVDPRGIWAIIIDITQIDAGNLVDLHDDLSDFTDYATKRKLPSLVRFSLEQALDLGRARWGTLVKGFEIKDLLINMGHGNILLENLTELREKIIRFNAMLARGRRLSDHMRTHFKHNDFLATLQFDDIDMDCKRMDEIASELSHLDIVKFRLDGGIEREKKSDHIGNVERILGEKGKQLIDVGGRSGGKSELHSEMLEI